MSFVFGYISGFHPIHASNGAVLIGVMFLCTFDSNGTLGTFLWTSTLEQLQTVQYYSQSISLAKHA